METDQGDSAPTPEPSSDQLPPLTNRGILVEIAVVLLLAVVPDLFRAVAHLVWNDEAPQSFIYLALWLLVRSAQVSAPLLLIVHYRRGAWSELGVLRPRIFYDSLVGVGTLLFSVIAVYGCLLPLYYGLYFVVGPDAVEWMRGSSNDMFPAPQSTISLVALVPMMLLANGFAEELVTRGYLIPQMEKLTGSTIAAVLVSTLLFAGYHAYQGPFGVLTTGIHGLVYGTVFCWTRRLWPVVLTHAATDLLALVWL